MRLDTQDQLTAINRFMDDTWAATQAAGGQPSFRRIQLAFNVWVQVPTDSKWKEFEEVLREEIGNDRAAAIVADLRPYLGGSRPTARHRTSRR